jgi:electron transfer flavoprotein alpha subunit
MASLLLVIAEERRGVIKRHTWEALAFARALADQTGAETAVTLLSNVVPDGFTDLAGHGADLLLPVVHPGLAPYTAEAHAGTLAPLIRETASAVVVLAGSAQGRDLAPRLAARLDAPLVMGALDARFTDGLFTAVRAVYGGKALAEVALSGTPAVVTIPPGLFPAARAQGKGRVQQVSVADPAPMVQILERIADPGGRVPLADAETIVAGGRGTGGNFAPIEELADLLGAAVGASRAAVDEGWRSHADQVGQTGAAVSPRLYVACAISGAVQHLAGIQNARCVVAVNTNPDAPVFKKASFGVQEDYREFLPALCAEIKKHKEA